MLMRFSIPQLFRKKIKAADLFKTCLYVSIFLHGIGYAGYYLSSLPKEINSDDISNLKKETIDVDFEIPPELPPELVGGTTRPAPIEKQEWIEGKSKDAPDQDDGNINTNALSGDGTDKDGYLYSYRGDKSPSVIIDFDLKKYFPKEAKFANITKKTVVVLVQVDEDGTLKNARIVSGKAGYGFDEAAMEIVHRVRFSPGYVGGRPVKMSHKVPIAFVLED
jgi:protein TonB